MSEYLPKNTDENGRDENGRFTDGNKGKPKGTLNKTTKQIREFLTNFLHDKSFEMAHIWDSLDDKDKATMYLHICRLVLPKQQEEEQGRPEVRPVIITLGAGIKPEDENDK
jgi:hypothetical protein